MFNGNPFRVYSLGMRLNRQRDEKKFRESLRSSAEPEDHAAPPSPRPRPTPEPELTREEEIALVLERIGKGKGSH